MSDLKIISRFKATVARIHNRGQPHNRQEWLDSDGISYEEVEFAFLHGDGNPLDVNVAMLGLRHASEGELGALFQTALGDYMGQLSREVDSRVTVVVALADQTWKKAGEPRRYAAYYCVDKYWDVRMLDLPPAEEWSAWPDGMILLAVAEGEEG